MGVSTHKAWVVAVANQKGGVAKTTSVGSLGTAFAEQGLAVLGFPCNQFGGQEPGDEEGIAAFCQKNYGVTFPMFAKVDVNGGEAHPLFRWLRQERGGVLGDKIKWNFTKFLVGRDGEVIKRYSPQAAPESLTADIQAALARPAPG